MKWIIRYYRDERSFKAGCPALTETVVGNRATAIDWAQRKMRNHPQYKFYDLLEA